MSGPDDFSTPPPEVPEEFAAAYREAYERALGQQGATGTHRAARHAAPPKAGDTQEQPAVAGLGLGGLIGEPVEEPAEPTHRADEEGWTEYTVQSKLDRFRASPWFVPALLVVAAAVLVLGAYGVGRIFAGGVDEAAPVAGQTADATVPASDPSARHTPGEHKQQHQPKPQKQQKQHAAPAVWKGAVNAVPIASAEAGCTAPSSVDAAGRPVSYGAGNAVDGLADTTWRCPGKAIGKKLVLHLGGKVQVGEVGLIPGYAKTDPVSGADRYAENNRITRVRWTFGDGHSVVQHLGGSAHDRSLRTVRVPKVTTDTVTLQVLAVREGPRDTTCISEVRVARAG
jgi:hypothetical protein